MNNELTDEQADKDAERYRYTLDCEVAAAQFYLPDLDPDEFKAKIRARNDAARAARDAAQGKEA